MLERLADRHGLVDYAAIDREARRWLDVLDCGIDTRVAVSHALGRADADRRDRQGAVARGAVLLLDEPTASITEHETAALFTLLRRLRDDGVAHRLRQPQARGGLRDRRPRDGAARRPQCLRRAEPMAGHGAAEARVADDRPRASEIADLGGARPTAATRCSRPRASRRRSATATSTSAFARGRDPRALRAGRRRAERARQGDLGLTAPSPPASSWSAASRSAIRDVHEALAPPPHRLRQRGPQAGGADPDPFGPRERRDHHLAAARRAASA